MDRRADKIKRLLLGEPVLCTTCKFCVVEDFGYSNYTVEGSNLDCLRGLNQALDGLERQYEPTGSLAQAIRFARQCPEYVTGEGPERDVDGETTAEAYKNDPDLYELLKTRWGST